jgi:hypothetical protein
VYLANCLKGSQKISLKVCYYIYTRHNSTKFLGINSDILQFYKLNVSTGSKSLHVLYINSCKILINPKRVIIIYFYLKENLFRGILYNKTKL